MALTKNRKRIYTKGLGRFEVREVEPSTGAFEDAGYITSATVTLTPEVDVVKIDNGEIQDVITASQTTDVSAVLSQTSDNEIELLRTAGSKVHAIRYSGLAATGAFQYFAFEACRIESRFDLAFLPNTARTLPIRAHALNRQDFVYSVPQMYFLQTNAEFHVPSLQLWYNPRLYLNGGTQYVLDISGFGRHGTMSTDFANMWWNFGGTPARYMFFDGSNDRVIVGDVCDIGATDDAMIALWVYVKAVDGTQQDFVAKQNAGFGTASNVGWAVYRGASNTMAFRLNDGTSSAAPTSAAGAIVRNTWYHCAIAIDRDGNGQWYINGVASGSPASVAGIGDSSNALNLTVAASSNLTEHGNVNIGGLSIWNFGAGGLPSNYATIISNLFNAERAYYGI